MLLLLLSGCRLTPAAVPALPTATASQRQPLKATTPPAGGDAGANGAAFVQAATAIVQGLPAITPAPDFRATGELHWPLSQPGVLKQIYGSQHPGIDVAAPLGAPILAADSGVVLLAELTEVYGNLVVVDHGNGYQTWYGHLDSFDVAPADGVKQGDVLGRVGSTGASTGPHLHFEVHFQGRVAPPLSNVTNAPQSILEASVAFERRTATAIARATQTALAFIAGQTATAQRAAELTRAAASQTAAFLSRTPTPSATPRPGSATPSATATASAGASPTVAASLTETPAAASATPEISPTIPPSATPEIVTPSRSPTAPTATRSPTAPEPTVTPTPTQPD